MTTSPQKYRICETRQEEREHVMEEQVELLSEPAQIRRGQLELMDANQLLARMYQLNPFGGYQLPVRPEIRKIMIETILRYERPCHTTLKHP